MGREHLDGFLRDLQSDGKFLDFDPDPMAELFTRLTMSITLTPDSALPFDDPAATRVVLRSRSLRPSA